MASQAAVPNQLEEDVASCPTINQQKQRGWKLSLYLTVNPLLTHEQSHCLFFGIRSAQVSKKAGLRIPSARSVALEGGIVA